MPGANVADWPIEYEDLAPFYDEVELKTGVQGDYDAMPARSREQSPHKHPYVMGPQPVSLAGKLLAEAGSKLGYTAFPQAAAVNSRRYQNRPACVSCGLCSGWGCGINARGDALVSWLNPAARMGDVRVIARAFVHRIETSRNGRRATGVRYVDHGGRERRLTGDIVIVAGSPINTARLLLLSANRAHPKGLGNRSDQVGRNMMFHNFTIASAVMTSDIHPLRAQSNSLQVDDLIGPFKGAEVTALGLPWLKGGLVQVGGGAPLFAESGIYSMIQPWGGVHKQLMKLGVLHRRVAGSQLVQEDVPQAENRIDLDPEVKDYHGFPAARITYSPHRHEQAASILLGARMEAWHALVAGAIGAAIVPYPVINSTPTYTAHLAGTARMGEDPKTSVCDASGRMHELDNVYIADASTWPTYAGHNPTNTIMANSLRIARGITGGKAPRRSELINERGW
jgi:choline dehydrogenase-like flavoprotein